MVVNHDEILMGNAGGKSAEILKKFTEFKVLKMGKEKCRGCSKDVTVRGI